MKLLALALLAQRIASMQVRDPSDVIPAWDWEGDNALSAEYRAAVVPAAVNVSVQVPVVLSPYIRIANIPPTPTTLADVLG
jgi:hypothetical protein